MKNNDRDERAKVQQEVGQILSSIQPRYQFTVVYTNLRGLEMACFQMLVAMAIFAIGLMLPLPLFGNHVFVLAGGAVAFFGVKKWIRHAPKEHAIRA